MRYYNWMLIVVITVKTNFIRCDNSTMGNSIMDPSVITCTLQRVDDTLKVDGACKNETVYLFFKHSRFHSFPHVFEYLTKLESVDISNAGVQQIDSTIFNRAIHLTTLDMRMSNMWKLQGHLFSHAINLTTLNIGNSSITECDKYAFYGLSNLKRLDLSDNKIVKLDTELFHPLSQLESLRLSDNKIQVISNDLFKHNTKLRWAYFDYNEIIFLDPAAFIYCQLKSLHLGFNQLRSVDLTTTKHLQDLNVSNNFLNILNVPIVTESIHAENNTIAIINSERGSALTKLYLSSNHLANLHNLTNLNQLLYLDLSDSRYHSVQFADLKSLTELKELKLTGNKLSEIEPNDVIVYLPKLKMIELSTKHWTNTYVKKLESELKKHNIDLVQDRAIIPEEDFINITTISPVPAATTIPTNITPLPDSGTVEQRLDAISRQLDNLRNTVSSNAIAQHIILDDQLGDMHKEIEDKIEKSIAANNAMNEDTMSKFKAYEAIVIIMFVGVLIFIIYKGAIHAKDFLHAMNYRRAQSRDALFNEQDL